MAKRNPSLALPENEQGQISIFFSASLVVMITIVAFVINVGLFVKAKINLQNATDSAAYAGAAVQARQLSKIAYLNWEMRNIYKEWMYKYYVIGNLNIQDVENPNGGGDTMDFRLEPDINVLKTGADRVTQDQFNIPAVCIHIAGSKTNICKRYSVPGLPEFGSSNLPGAEEASRAFMDTLISTKINDCIDRTRLNMTVATTWTYNVLANDSDDALRGRGPAILADRQGAWPRAVEVAMRIRNLEYVMNRPAVTEGVCISPGNSTKFDCARSIDDISQEQKLGNERIVKAFYSGYRNLGNSEDREMKDTFKLTEIPPQVVTFENDADASNLLIPNKSNFRQKQWVDLKLMMVNYAIFYAALIPRADEDTSGACDISKVAIPVPGYPMGFYKNPDVLTYYAVKGEAEFVGMFNPFAGSDYNVKMTAYSAAKPFGGRIGPMLFTQKQGNLFITGRGDPKFRSLPYITSYDFTGATIRNQTYDESAGVNFVPGLPLPTNSTEAPGSFWLEEATSPIGGKLDANSVQFGVPNLVYDYQVPFRDTGYSLSTGSIHKIIVKDPNSEQPVGLFSKEQFRKFKGTNLSPNITPLELEAEIARVKFPTSYEAGNYLIPTPNIFNMSVGLDSFGFINGEKRDLPNGIVQYNASIYAPLYKTNNQTDVIYPERKDVTDAIFEFMLAQESGMLKYKMALNKAAINIYKMKDKITEGAQGSAPGYERSAKGVSDIDFNGEVDQDPASCDSIAGQFLAFYYGGETAGPFQPADPANCPTPLGNMILSYFNNLADDNYDPTFYNMNFSWKQQVSKEEGKSFMTAYLPGPFTGIGPDGFWTNPIPGSNLVDDMRRNTYSTKFVALDSLLSNRDASYDNKQFAIHSEGDTENTSPDTTPNLFRNPLNPEGANADISSIKY